MEERTAGTDTGIPELARIRGTILYSFVYDFDYRVQTAPSQLLRPCDVTRIHSEAGSVHIWTRKNTINYHLFCPNNNFELGFIKYNDKRVSATSTISVDGVANQRAGGVA